jgi:hypothetical protein
MTATPLDRAHAAAHAPGAPEAAMARFWALMVETALHVPVTPAPEDAPLAPLVFPLETGPVALAFDDDARMAAFFEAPTDYVTLTGRSLVAALAEAGLGLGLNLGDAPSATLLDGDTVRWIAAEMGGEVEALDLTGALTVAPPVAAPRALAVALAERVAAMPGLIAEAWLVALTPDGAAPSLALLIRPAQAARRAVAGLVTVLGRAAAVHGAEAGPVAVGVVEEGHPLLPAARAHGRALHAPPEAAAAPAAPRPAAPPRLR